MAGPTRSRDELISSLAGSLFAAMLKEVVMDAALQAHRDIVRGKAICDVCGMRCGSVHAQAVPFNSVGPSTAVQPVPSSPATAGKTVTGMNTPTTRDKNDGNIYFECTNCQKKIASNRYAPHLSSCLGIGTGSRRGAARNAAAKNKFAEPDHAGSPFASSDYGSPSEGVNGKGKGKAKNGKKVNGKAAESWTNGNHKRLKTPDAPPTKKTKKQKTSTAVPEQLVTVTLDGTTLPKPHIPTASKRPPKNGTTSGSPDAPGSPDAASGSQYSGNDSPSASGSGSSYNAQSPRGVQKAFIGTDPSSTNSKRRGGPGKKQFTMAEAATAKRNALDKDPDFIDVDGEDRDESSSDST